MGVSPHSRHLYSREQKPIQLCLCLTCAPHAVTWTRSCLLLNPGLQAWAPAGTVCGEQAPSGVHPPNRHSCTLQTPGMVPVPFDKAVLAWLWTLAVPPGGPEKQPKWWMAQTPLKWVCPTHSHCSHLHRQCPQGNLETCPKLYNLEKSPFSQTALSLTLSIQNIPEIPLDTGVALYQSPNFHGPHVPTFTSPGLNCGQVNPP